MYESSVGNVIDIIWDVSVCVYCVEMEGCVNQNVPPTSVNAGAYTIFLDWVYT